MMDARLRVVRGTGGRFWLLNMLHRLQLLVNIFNKSRGLTIPIIVLVRMNLARTIDANGRESHDVIPLTKWAV